MRGFPFLIFCFQESERERERGIFCVFANGGVVKACVFFYVFWILWWETHTVGEIWGVSLGGWGFLEMGLEMAGRPPFTPRITS
jgi:hypothetical protein